MTARAKLSWSDLRGTRAGVWGLGREGMANVRKLVTLGATPVLVDDNPAEPVADGFAVLATGAGGLAALGECDVVVKSPGISRYRPEVAELEGRGVPVAGGLGLWMQEADTSRVVCVTGTKGKSTVTSIAGHLISGLGYRCLIGGNIGQPPYDPRLGGGPWDYWVIEVSSYQATDLASSPPVVAVTSLSPDHLPWHGGVENYYRDKLSACSQPGADLTVANGDSPLLREYATLMGPRIEWVHAAAEPGATWMEPLALLGEHNRRNALIARRCLVALGVPGAADDTALAAAAAGFEQLPSRLQVIGEVDGVTFVDDSLSTNVLPTVAALDAFGGRRVALIVGGQDRGIDYGPLADALVERAAPTFVLTLPDSGPRIHAAIEAAVAAAASASSGPAAAPGPAGVSGPGGASSPSGVSGLAGVCGPLGVSARAGVSGLVGVTDCADLDEAVAAGFAWVRPDGVMLLSPAAPSFGRFRDYRDRGDAFARAMGACTLLSVLQGVAAFCRRFLLFGVSQFCGWCYPSAAGVRISPCTGGSAITS
jgi:UDP-N-acetylmuramoyl-L-alanine---L-glutamate ligase